MEKIKEIKEPKPRYFNEFNKRILKIKILAQKQNFILRELASPEIHYNQKPTRIYGVDILSLELCEMKKKLKEVGYNIVKE